MDELERRLTFELADRGYDWRTIPDLIDDIAPAIRLAAAPVVLVDSLRYISCPSMGLPAGVDPEGFALEGATEDAVRRALATCIRNARGALETVSLSGDSLGHLHAKVAERERDEALARVDELTELLADIAERILTTLVDGWKNASYSDDDPISFEEMVTLAAEKGINVIDSDEPEVTDITKPASWESMDTILASKAIKDANT